jgi:predicted TIM-barrel fold metal-dependent hydrolase
MSATTCPRCGRERGLRYYQCHPDELAECLGVALARVERERDEARAEVGRLRAIGVELLGEHKATAERLREMLRIAESTRDAAQAIATRETERRRDVEERLRRHDDGVEGFLRYTGLRRDLDAMRELAWSWCIEARAERMRATLQQARAQRAIREAAELERDECPPQPIESLGPVPLSASHMHDMHDGCTVGVSREMRTLAWLVRDAVRRGAKLQGGE